MTISDVQIWRIDLTHFTANPGELAHKLSADEQDRAKRFQFARDSNRFTICRAALRDIIATTLQIDSTAVEFTTGPYGKPRLAGGDLRFNVSHSGEYALIALAYHRELGIDIEKIRPLDDALEIASRFFSPEEAQRLSLLTGTEFTSAFFECWTRKEAFIKAIGEGLSHPLDTFNVTFFPDERVELRIGIETRHRWVLANIDTAPGYRSALVFERLPDTPDCRLVYREWTRWL